MPYETLYQRKSVYEDDTCKNMGEDDCKAGKDDCRWCTVSETNSKCYTKATASTLPNASCTPKVYQVSYEPKAKEQSEFRTLIQKMKGHENHKKDRHSHHKRSIKMMHLSMALLIAFHFYTMKKLSECQEELEELKKKQVEQAQLVQQPVAIAPPALPVVMTQSQYTDWSVAESNNMI